MKPFEIYLAFDAAGVLGMSVNGFADAAEKYDEAARNGSDAVIVKRVTLQPAIDATGKVTLTIEQD